MNVLVKLAKELYKGFKKIDLSEVVVGYVTGCKQV